MSISRVANIALTSASLMVRASMKRSNAASIRRRVALPSSGPSEIAVVSNCVLVVMLEAACYSVCHGVVAEIRRDIGDADLVVAIALAAP